MNLPRIISGDRGWMVARLVVYGLAHAAAAYVLARSVHASLSSESNRGIDLVGTAGLVLLVAAMYGLRVLEARDAEALGQDYVLRVRKRILLAAGRGGAESGRRSRLGVTMSRLITDLSSLQQWISQGLARMISAGTALVGLLFALAAFDPQAGGLLGAVVIMTLVGSGALTPALRRRVREVRRRRGRLANRVGEQLLSSLTARHFGQLDRESTRTLGRGRKVRDAMVRRAIVASLIRRAPEMAHALSLVAFAWLLAPRLTDTGQRHGGAAVILILLGLSAAALRDLARAWDYRVSFEQARARIHCLLRNSRPPAPESQVALVGDSPVEIRFEIALPPPDGNTRILHARGGDRIAVSGPSGTGKTRLLHLAAGILPARPGEVRLNDVDIASVKDLHRVVQLVSPAVPLIPGTLERNLRYAKETADENRLLKVARLAGLETDRRLFPEGLRTRVDDGGQNLPSGARARVCLARALLADPRLLLVDDPAFLLDPAAKRALQELLELTPATLLFVAGEAPFPFLPSGVWHLGTELSADTPHLTPLSLPAPAVHTLPSAKVHAISVA